MRGALLFPRIVWAELSGEVGFVSPQYSHTAKHFPIWFPDKSFPGRHGLKLTALHSLPLVVLVLCPLGRCLGIR